MIECAELRMRQWRDKDVRDITQEMMAMTLDIAVRTLFGSTLQSEAEEVGDSLGFLMRYSLRKARSPSKYPKAGRLPRIAAPIAKRNSSIRWSTESSKRARQKGIRTSTTIFWPC